MPRKLLLFVAAGVIQLGVLAWMIVGHERVLQEGAVYRFRTAPIDPRDPFRGEYVVLNFEVERGRWPMYGNANTVAPSMHAFGLLGTDSAGFARIVSFAEERPEAGDFIPVEYLSWTPDTLFGVALPFDRYYLEEGDGPKTEQLMAPQWNGEALQQPLPSYAVVRIHQGEAVIEDLMVGDRSIHEWLKEPLLDAPMQQTAPTPISVPAGS
ncbi:MAG TPA: GDYXXLXY domain-containing protein [Flavobacteriales bacterium]|nr:GDYXXLXY domain-containing protein [Flavobacteriales bacterium]